jgi:hypothetical protein
MSLKILVYSDLQATDGHERCFNSPGLSLQQWRVQKFYTDLYRVYQDHGCSALWDLGDTTDDRSSVPVPTIDAVITGLRPFPNQRLNIKLIGNHEQYLRDTSVHIGRLFESKFEVIDKVFVDVVDEETVLICCAYPETDAKLVAWLSETQYKYRNMRQVLLGHFQVAGCELQTGTAVTGVPKSLLRKFQLGLLGHIHKPQELVENVYYVGSPFQQNFGEANEDKRVGIVDLKTLAVEWIELSGYPVYSTVEFSEFKKYAIGHSEDRFKVILRSPEESQEFFAHPLAGRVEPIYDYKLSSGQSEELNAGRSWTSLDVMARYLKKITPASKGIDIAEEEMLDYGQTIAGNVQGV